MCRGDVLFCKVKNITLPTLNIYFSWQVWLQINKPTAIEVGIYIRLRNSHTGVSYLCYCRSSHNSPFPGGSYHKPLRFSPSRIRTGPDWTTSSDTGWTWTANWNDYRHTLNHLSLLSLLFWRKQWWWYRQAQWSWTTYPSSGVPGELHHFVKLFNSKLIRRSSPAPSPSMRRRFRMTSSKTKSRMGMKETRDEWRAELVVSKER